MSGCGEQSWSTQLVLFLSKMQIKFQQEKTGALNQINPQNCFKLQWRCKTPIQLNYDK